MNLLEFGLTKVYAARIIILLLSIGDDSCVDSTVHSGNRRMRSRISTYPSSKKQAGGIKVYTNPTFPFLGHYHVWGV